MRREQRSSIPAMHKSGGHSPGADSLARGIITERPNRARCAAPWARIEPDRRPPDVPQSSGLSYEGEESSTRQDPSGTPPCGTNVAHSRLSPEPRLVWKPVPPDVSVSNIGRPRMSRLLPLVNRRTFLQSTGIRAAALCAPSVLCAQNAIIRIGVLHPMCRGRCPIPASRAALAPPSAIDEINAAGGIKVARWSQD